MPDMPKYQCSTTVSALKIADVQFSTPNGGHCTLTFEDEQFSPVNVTVEFTNKYVPQVGGYYVVYSDGNPGYVGAEYFDKDYKEVTQ